MSSNTTVFPFAPAAPDEAGIISWAHIGDLHMTANTVQNLHDLRAIVAELNSAFADSLNFVFLPGDIADDGSHEAYAVVRRVLDDLRFPWCAVVGDHDVHEKSFTDFLTMMAAKTYYAFRIANTRFLALNAFDVPDPGSFTLLPEQLAWCERELRQAPAEDAIKIMLLHCYPSELKVGGERLIELIRQHNVRLVAMAHTHHTQLPNDGRTLYSASRSTGQIEEGPVGFSVTNLDGPHVSWRFLELGALPAIMITAPSDARLQTDECDSLSASGGSFQVRAKIWGVDPIVRATAHFAGNCVPMRKIGDSRVWQVTVHYDPLATGRHELRVTAENDEGRNTEDTILFEIGQSIRSIARPQRDLENALEAWPEHGLLGTQLGPNKNGRKW